MPVHAEEGRGYAQGDPQERRAAASPLPVLQTGDRFHPAGRQRSRCRRNQTDRVPHRFRFRADGSPDRRRAARQGRTVIVELLARFDEEANINWATRLEQVGAHVVYGVVGHKTHARC